MLDFPAPAGPITSVLLPRISPPAERRVEALHARSKTVLAAALAVLGGDQARENPHAPGFDGEIVIAVPERRAPQLYHVDPPARNAVILRRAVERDDSVRDAPQLQVGRHRTDVVEQQHGTVPPREKLLQREHLAPVPQRVARQQPQFGKRIEDHPRRRKLLHPDADLLHRFAQLNLLRLENRVLILGAEAPDGCVELIKIDSLQRPSVRPRHLAQLFLRLRQRDV
jgi:hypothetical protein